MFNLDRFIADKVTGRKESLFASDIEAYKDRLSQEIMGSSVLVIGGAGSIGSRFIRSVCRFLPAKLVVVDLSENGLAALTRDLRSSYGLEVPPEFRQRGRSE